MTVEGIQMLSGDYTAPVLMSCTVTGSRTIQLLFSKKITITNAVITSEAVSSEENIPDSTESLFESAAFPADARTLSASYSDDGVCVVFTSDSVLETGLSYYLYGETEDAAGNTLTFCIPFTGYNDHIPVLVIAGIQPRYKKNDETYRCEFVELYVVKSGNIAGLQIVSAADGADTAYTMPAAEVTAGEFIIVHLRSMGDDCVSETAESLSGAAGTYTSPAALDLWAENKKSRLNDTADVVMVQNPDDGRLLDAVLYMSYKKEMEESDAFRSAAARVVAAGIWENSDKPASIDSLTTTASAMLIRTDGDILKSAAAGDKEIPSVFRSSAENWTVIKIEDKKSGKSNLGCFPEI
jgi:hypothetical protein